MTTNWKPIDGRILSIPEAEIAIAETRFANWRPSGGALHNTAVPSLKRSKDYPIEHWRSMWEGYYRGQGWSAGPHFFCFPNKILFFTPITLPGVHSPSWNGSKFGVEMVADFDKEPADSGDGLLVVQAAVAVFAALYSKIGLNPDGIKLHKEDPRTTHACPGRNIDKVEFINLVEQYMGTAGEHALPAPMPALVTPKRHGTVNTPGDTLTLRREPSASSASMGVLPHGTEVVINSEAVNVTTKWLNVTTPASYTGWVNGKFVVE